jgi:hypothetical protein
MDDMVAMARLIDALRPWLHHVVFVGGWAHRLHRHHPLANAPAHQPLGTRDADVAFASRASLRGDIRAALATAGFEEMLTGDDTPPIAEYRLGAENQGFYVEFLTPLQGSGMRRDGTADTAVRKAGITAQKVRHLEILLVKPWSVALGTEVGIPLSDPAELALPNPVTFIAQRLLIQKYRSPGKSAQDALYIHDTLELFGGELETLRSLWRDGVRPELTHGRAAEIQELCVLHFSTVTDVIRTAVRMPIGRDLSADRVQRACAYGLEVVFAE